MMVRPVAVSTPLLDSALVTSLTRMDSALVPSGTVVVVVDDVVVVVDVVVVLGCFTLPPESNAKNRPTPSATSATAAAATRPLLNTTRGAGAGGRGGSVTRVSSPTSAAATTAPGSIAVRSPWSIAARLVVRSLSSGTHGASNAEVESSAAT